MDHCATVLLAFPPPEVVAADSSNLEIYENAMRTHCNRVSKLFKEQSGALAVNALNLLEVLDPAVHSLSYLALLETLIPAEGQLQDIEPTVVDKILVFLVTFDPRQIRYIGAPFTTLFSAVASGLVIPAPIAVDVLSKALLKIDPTGSMLTSNHVSLVRFAYQANVIPPILPLISKTIVFYPGMANTREPKLLGKPTIAPPEYITKDTGLTAILKSSQVLEYDYIVGLIHCSVRDWASARDAFARVTSFPTRDNGVSKVMVEAHKKWVLTGLVLQGKAARTPPHTGTQASKSFGVLSKPYLQVAESFDSMDAEALRTSVQASWQTFVDDQNVGLVREVVAAHQKWQIANLRDVYAKVAIAQVRAETRSADTGSPLTTDAEVEALVQDMIASGMLRASIRKPDGGEPAYLEFLPAADELSEAEYAEQIRASAQRLQDLILPAYRTTAERLTINRDYIRHVLKEQKREKEGGGAGAGGAGAGSLGFEEQVEDEDLMTGVLSGFA